MLVAQVKGKMHLSMSQNHGGCSEIFVGSGYTITEHTGHQIYDPLTQLGSTLINFYVEHYQRHVDIWWQ